MINTIVKAAHEINNEIKSKSNYLLQHITIPGDLNEADMEISIHIKFKEEGCEVGFLK